MSMSPDLNLLIQADMEERAGPAVVYLRVIACGKMALPQYRASMSIEAVNEKNSS